MPQFSIAFNKLSQLPKPANLLATTAKKPITTGKKVQYAKKQNIVPKQRTA